MYQDVSCSPAGAALLSSPKGGRERNINYLHTFVQEISERNSKTKKRFLLTTNCTVRIANATFDFSQKAKILFGTFYTDVAQKSATKRGTLDKKEHFEVLIIARKRKSYLKQKVNNYKNLCTI